MQPIGALNPARLKKFQDHYSSLKDPIIPKFHYGSHYSNPGTVHLSYMSMLSRLIVVYLCLLFGVGTKISVKPFSALQ